MTSPGEAAPFGVSGSSSGAERAQRRSHQYQHQAQQARPEGEGVTEQVVYSCIGCQAHAVGQGDCYGHAAQSKGSSKECTTPEVYKLRQDEGRRERVQQQAVQKRQACEEGRQACEEGKQALAAYELGCKAFRLNMPKLAKLMAPTSGVELLAGRDQHASSN